MKVPALQPRFYHNPTRLDEPPQDLDINPEDLVLATEQSPQNP